MYKIALHIQMTWPFQLMSEIYIFWLMILQMFWKVGVSTFNK